MLTWYLWYIDGKIVTQKIFLINIIVHYFIYQEINLLNNILARNPCTVLSTILNEAADNPLPCFVWVYTFTAGFLNFLGNQSVNFGQVFTIEDP